MMFFDDEKTADENRHEFERARHNKEVLQYGTAAVALFTAVCAAVLASKKLYDELS